MGIALGASKAFLAAKVLKMFSLIRVLRLGRLHFILKRWVQVGDHSFKRRAKNGNKIYRSANFPCLMFMINSVIHQKLTDKELNQTSTCTGCNLTKTRPFRMLEIICIHISDIRTESIGYQDITTALLLFHDRALECLYTVLRGVLEGLS